MGQMDRSPSDYIMPPRSLKERLSAVANGHAASVEEPTASLMAQRFAPELQPVAEEAISPVAPGLEPLQAREAAKSLLQHDPWPFVPKRTLAMVLIIAVLTPATALSILVWKGAIALPWPAAAGTSRGSEQLAALAGDPPAPETVLPKQDAILPAVALTAPATLQAEAGKAVPFTITLDSTEPLPARSTITISGLAKGTTFSDGRPYGEAEWSLRPDEIGDLALTLPEDAQGQSAISIALVTADGSTIATATTELLMSTDAKASLVLRPEESDRVNDLIARGRKMIEVGYLAGARSYYRRAAEAGSGEASFALAATYDPALIQEMGAQGIKPDVAEARAWYGRARTLGIKEAEAELARLNTLDPTGAAPLPAGGTLGLGLTAMTAPAPVANGSQQPSLPNESIRDWIELSGSANLRENPSSNATTIKVVERGTKFLEIGKQGGWVHVTDPTTQETGWVYSRYVAAAAAGQ
jgi:hypothetical protein